MQRQILSLLTVLTATTRVAAEAKDDVVAAARKLGEKPNYSWKTTVVVPERAQFRPGPTEGKSEKDGYLYVKSAIGERTSETIKQGEKAVFPNRDGEWQPLADAEGQEGPGRFQAGMVHNLRRPADEAAEIAGGVKEFKQQGEAFGGELKAEAATALMRFRYVGGNQAPAITGAKGATKFWIKDGVLTRYEFTVSGKMEFNGNAVDLDRTTTVGIKDVGMTGIELPEGAKKKLL